MSCTPRARGPDTDDAGNTDATLLVRRDGAKGGGGLLDLTALEGLEGGTETSMRPEATKGETDNSSLVRLPSAPRGSWRRLRARQPPSLEHYATAGQQGAGQGIGLWFVLVSPQVKQDPCGAPHVILGSNDLVG